MTRIMRNIDGETLGLLGAKKTKAHISFRVCQSDQYFNRVGSHVVFAWIHCTDVRIHCTDILIEYR